LTEDAELLNRIRQYEQVALAEAYDQYYDRIYRYVYRFLGQAGASEDLTASVFVRLLTAVRNGNSPRQNLSAWLYRVAHNLVVDSFRRKPTEDLELAEWLEGHDPDVLHTVEQQLQLDRVRQALLDLTPSQQQVIVLKFVEGLESQEIAGIMDRSEGAVDALQHRALLALRKTLLPQGSQGPGAGALASGEPDNDDMETRIAPDRGISQVATLLTTVCAWWSRAPASWRLAWRGLFPGITPQALPLVASHAPSPSRQSKAFQAAH